MEGTDSCKRKATTENNTWYLQKTSWEAGSKKSSEG